MNIELIDHNDTKKCIFVIKDKDTTYYSVELYNTGTTIVCYGNNKLFTLFDDTSNKYYDENTGSLECGGLNFLDIIVDYCVIPEYDKILNNLKL